MRFLSLDLLHVCTHTPNTVLVGQEVEDVVAEMAAVAGILGLSDRITQELVSLQPRRARLLDQKRPCHGIACKAMRLTQTR